MNATRGPEIEIALFRHFELARAGVLELRLMGVEFSERFFIR
jgi:hypothetical protein